ncbi:MAG: DUF1499 domain-containing protein [Gammaproteobacteria bacterium]|nr:DUF1499 domain-containing protein [Gammaproteobacteria bacterium]
MTGKSSRGTKWCKTGIWLCLIGVAMVAIGLIGVQIELLSPLSAFMLFGIGALLLAPAAVSAAIGIAISMGTGGNASALLSWVALVLSITVIGTALSLRPDSGGAPPIHDLTTNTENPPAFDAIIALRGDSSNPPEYAGEETADLQQQAFPDLVTIIIARPADEVFPIAAKIAADSGWDIVAEQPETGRIEATDSTQWFRFKDDVVIRLTPLGSATAVDMRSKSRVGQGDMGTNARRIQIFMDQLTAQAAE